MITSTPELQINLEKMNTRELKELARERGFNSKDAALYGQVQRRDTWEKLLKLNPEKPVRKKPTTSKQRIVYGLQKLPQIKTIIYSYGGGRA